MRRVVTVSLNGNAYQIEEGGYEALHAYLEEAQQKLRDDPDCAEIIADLEQAIAEKCARFLNERKGVIGAEELQQILSEMGPVDGGTAADTAAAAGAAAEGTSGGSGGTGATGGAGGTGGTGAASASGATSAAAGAPRRLYQIREGALISGVCKGIAAYFNVDVLIVRIIFVALALLTWGAWILVYLVLMFVIPFAHTSEDRAAAHGLPFNAQLLVEETKRYYAQFKRDAQWRHYRHREAHWRHRRQRSEWREHWRREREALRAHRRGGWWAPPPPPPPPGAGPYTSAYTSAGYAAQLLAGVLAPLAALGNAALLILLLIAVVQLITHGAVFGWPRPAGLPLWAGLLVLVILYSVVSMPLRALRHAVYYSRGAATNVWLALWGSVLWIVFIVLCAWLASHYWPQLQHWLQQLTNLLGGARPVGQSIRWIGGAA